MEPWFLGGGKASEGGADFEKKVVDEWKPKGVAFHASPAEGLFAKAQGPVKIALVAGRTLDNPKLFRAAMEAGATHILLEKPGAPTVAELEAMAAEAKAKGVSVYMGFIKNVSAYLTNALEVQAKHQGSSVVLESRNDYNRDNLAECFARNSEGLLKNMAIHELALAVQFFGLTADTVDQVDSQDPNGTECLTLDGRTDFSRVDFTLRKSNGIAVRIKADRCAGDGCCARVLDADGAELYVGELVDEARAERVRDRMAQHPDWLGYLITQEDEYAKLKELCAKGALDRTLPPNVASVDVAIQALKLAEYLTPILKDKLAA